MHYKPCASQAIGTHKNEARSTVAHTGLSVIDIFKLITTYKDGYTETKSDLENNAEQVLSIKCGHLPYPHHCLPLLRLHKIVPVNSQG